MLACHSLTSDFKKLKINNFTFRQVTDVVDATIILKTRKQTGKKSISIFNRSIPTKKRWGLFKAI